MSEVTQILFAIEQGEAKAADQLLPLVYDELRKLAAQMMAREAPGQTLQTTALVHEAYLRLVGAERAGHWHSVGHFFAACAEAMRRILVENARRKRRLKRGGNLKRHELEHVAVVTWQPDVDILELEAALARLELKSARTAQVVILRCFVGMTIEETASALGVSPSTVDRDWTYARAWLFRELTKVD